jgi:hypothetical protein
MHILGEWVGTLGWGVYILGVRIMHISKRKEPGSMHIKGVEDPGSMILWGRGR